MGKKCELGALLRRCVRCALSVRFSTVRCAAPSSLHSIRVDTFYYKKENK